MTVSSTQYLLRVCLGNLFEHYDTALFGFLSPFLAPLIFPEQDPLTALLLTYAIIPLGMLAKPLGALVFGYIGDIYGRSYSLFLTLSGMAVISACIAFTPTYQQAGIFAPLLFWLGRMGQNFLAAGETMGGGIFVLENAPEKRQDLISGFYAASGMGGYLLASLGVYLISHYQAVDLGWRFLYLCGSITALFGCMIRRFSFTMPSSPHSKPAKVELKKTLWTYRRELATIAICAGFSQATYLIALVLLNGLIPLLSPMTKSEIMKMNTYLLILDFCLLPFFGWIASKVSREKFMLVFSLGSVLLAIPLLLGLEGASVAEIVGIRILFVVLGVAFFAPFQAWAQNLVPAHCRYIIISFGYAIGSQLLGSPTAAIALWCFQKTSMITSIGWYWMFLGAASSLSIFLLVYSRASKKDLKFAVDK